MSRVRWFLSALLVVFCHASLFAAGPRPNIVVILADDFGVGDIQAHYPRNKIATPHLDRLVREGLSFRDAHSASAVCSPTRYGLLTGRYAWRTRLQEWVLACYEPPLIDEQRLTLPAFLKRHGYHTACIGKWHLGWEWPGPQPSRTENITHALKDATWDFEKPIRGGPTERGFDQYFGVDLPNYPPFTFIENDRVTLLPTAKFQSDNRRGLGIAEVFNEAPMAAGWRFDNVLPEITRRAVDYVKGRAETGEPFFLYFALTSPHTPIAPSKQFAGKSGIAPIADFVMETDWAAGQVIEAIDAAGLSENTIVIFTADNGHAGTGGWKQLVKAGHKPSGPYSGRKGDIWEGGHRVPFIMRWPGRVTAGTESHDLLCLNDLFATCAQLLGSNLPDEAAEDSFSFLREALGHDDESGIYPRRRQLVSHSVHGEFAFRDGDWKLVYTMAGPNIAASRGKRTVAKLYNLKTDVGERHDVAVQQAGLVELLTNKLREVIDRGVSRAALPRPNDRQVRFDVIPTARWSARQN
jgi:arylsulfatase A-like enzyme